MRHNIRAVFLTAAFGLLVSPASLSAGTLGPSCSSCYGSIYTLDYLGLTGSTATTETHRVSLTIDATNFVEPKKTPNQYITSVALKITNNLLGAVLESAPGTLTDWTVVSGGLNANDCSGQGAGFVCAEDGNPNGAPTNVSSPIYSWVFRITMGAGSLFTGDGEAHIKANYDPMGGTLVSEDITLGGEVPEPATLALLAGGLGVWAWSRRRTNSVAAQ